MCKKHLWKSDILSKDSAQWLPSLVKIILTKDAGHWLASLLKMFNIFKKKFNIVI